MVRYCYIADDGIIGQVFSPESRRVIAAAAGSTGPIIRSAEISQYIDDLSECEVIFSSWGMPCLDRYLLEKLPRLSFVFYAAGSIRYFTTDAMWDRGVRVCSAWRANAVPVADYTVGAVLMSLKRVWHYAS
ncbi:MAG TPA: glycerate dehydrogenase, partial [Spirochaetota bacterium]